MNNTREVETAVAAYNCNFKKFIANCDYGFKRQRIIHACICRGCAFSYTFAQNLWVNRNDISYFMNKRIKRAVCASFIMNNQVELDLIKETKPFCIWFPSVPTLETCKTIKKGTNEIDYSLAILCILMNWYDFFITLDIEAESTLLTICQTTKRTKFYDFLSTKVQEHKVYNIINFKHEIVRLDTTKYDTEFKPKDIDLFSFHTGYAGRGWTRSSLCLRNPHEIREELDVKYGYIPYFGYRFEYLYPGGYGELYGCTFEYFAVTRNFAPFQMDYDRYNEIEKDRYASDSEDEFVQYEDSDDYYWKLVDESESSSESSSESPDSDITRQLSKLLIQH